MSNKRENNRLFKASIAPFAPEVRSRLSEIRKLILDRAKTLEDVGPLLEALRWGQFSFLTAETGSGSTIRIDGRRNQPEKLAIYFHCQSGLVSNFRELYPMTFKFEGERAIVLDSAEPLPRAELEHCISLALTHHLRKKLTPKTKRRIAHAKSPHHNRH